MLLARIIGGVVGVVILAALAEAWLKRGKAPRPLSERMRDGMKETAETPTPLGMEATDLEQVERAQKLADIAGLKSKDVRFK